MDASRPDYVAGIYWRKNAFWGGSTVPVIMSLVDGRLAMVSTDKMEFEVPVREVTAKFSKLSTMVLVVGGTKYAFVGRSAQISPDFTPSQVQYLHSLGAQVAPRTGMDHWVSGLNALLTQGAASANVGAWREILAANDVQPG